jgi:NitT/TauT family transport system substrate-binding protein
VKTRLRHVVLALCLLALLIGACSTTPTPAPPPTAPVPMTAPTSAPVPAGSLTEVSVVMGYIPNIQFAPLYVAEEKGYFTEAGIKVKRNWGFELDGIKLVGANQADFALLGGDQVIQARSQNIPLVYVANYYNAFPISIFSLKEHSETQRPHREKSWIAGILRRDVHGMARLAVRREHQRK